MYDNARFSEKYGVVSGNVTLDHSKVVNRKNKVVKTLVSGVKAQLKKNKVTLVEGIGEIVGRNNEGYEVKVANETYVGKRLLIATGSVPIIPPIQG